MIFVQLYWRTNFSVYVFQFFRLFSVRCLSVAIPCLDLFVFIYVYFVCFCFILRSCSIIVSMVG